MVSLPAMAKICCGQAVWDIRYGCVLVSTANAAQLFEWEEEGVVVEIRP